MKDLRCVNSVLASNHTLIDEATNSLTIHFSQHYFSISIHNKENQCLRYEQWEYSPQSENIPILVSERKNLESFLIFWKNTDFKAYHTTRILFNTPIFTLIPTSLFSPKEASSLLSYNHTITQNDTMFYDELSEIGITNIYAISNQQADIIKEIKPTASIYSDKTLLIKIANKTTFDAVHCHIDRTTITLLVVKNGALLLCNTFNYTTEKDLLYYILLSYKKLSLSLQETPLIASGEVHISHPFYALALRYIQHVKFAESPPASYEPLQIQTEDQHNIFFHLYSPLCE